MHACCQKRRSSDRRPLRPLKKLNVGRCRRTQRAWRFCRRNFNQKYMQEIPITESTTRGCCCRLNRNGIWCHPRIVFAGRFDRLTSRPTAGSLTAVNTRSLSKSTTCMLASRILHTSAAYNRTTSLFLVFYLANCASLSYILERSRNMGFAVVVWKSRRHYTAIS